MEFRILGPLQVLADDRQVALGAAQQREVLAILLVHRGEVVSVDRIVDELWGERPPNRATKTVQVYVSRLRKELGEGVLVTRDGGYALELGGDSVDADRFSQLADEGRRALEDGDPRAARETLNAALDLWRGPPLADLAYESFAQSEAARLEELRMVALENRAEADLALGRYAELAAELEALVREHPTRERLREGLMLALYRSGRQVEALESYRDGRRALDEQLGLEPGPRLQQLERSILTHDPAIEGPPATGPMAVLRRRRRGGMLVALGGALLLAVAIVAVVVSTGSDGVSTIDENSVGLIEPDSGALSGQFAVGRGPSAAAAGAGSVWVANQRDGTVSRVDADTRQIRTIDVGRDPSALAFGGGSMWVATAEDRGVSQIDPGTNRILTTIEVGNAPSGVAVAFGAVWVTTAVDGTVTRIDLERESPAKTTIPLGASATAITAGAGAVWVASEASGRVIRIDPDSARVANAINVGNGPAAVAFGAGAVWVANRQDGTVSRIDPRRDAVTETLPVGIEPTAIAAGEGAVWVANGGDGTLARIDPGSRRVTKTIEVGSSPSALVVADGSVWTTALALPESHRGGTLRLEWPAYDKSVKCRCADPIAYLSFQGVWLASLAYDGLVAYRRVGGAGGARLVANLASEVPEPSADGRTYVFELRRGLRFSNGAPVRPEDFRHSLERFLRLDFSPSSYFDGVPGARRCRARPRRCDLSKGIETDSKARTITIHLRARDAEFLHELTLPVASVLPADTPMRFARRLPPGTGPYRIARFDVRRGGRLVRNRYFRPWSEEARPDGFADEIAIDVGGKIDAQLAAIRGSDADVVSLSEGLWTRGLRARLRQLAIQYGGQIHSAPEPQLEQVLMNVQSAPFDDARARQALNYAVDRGELVELAGGAQIGRPTCQVLPPGFPGYRPHCRYTLNPNPAGTWTAPDLATAKRLVRESGTSGSRVRVMVLADQRPLGRYFASLMRRLGYRSSLLVLPPSAYYPAIFASPQPINIWWFGWVADSLAPSAFLQPLFGCGEEFSPSCDRRIDAQMNRALAQQSADPTAANALWEQIDRRLADRALAVPLFNRQHLTLVSNRVGNVQHHPLWGVLYDQLWVK